MKRPAIVWSICIFYLFSAGWTLLSYLLIYLRLIPLNEAQEAYFRSLTIFDYGSTMVIAASNLLGAVLLFRLKREAFHFFVAAFTLGLALAGYQIVAKNWIGAIGGPGLVGTVLGWGTSVAIIIYSKRLTSTQPDELKCRIRTHFADRGRFFPTQGSGRAIVQVPTANRYEAFSA